MPGSLSPVDQERIYEMFNHLTTPTTNIVGKWAVFKNGVIENVSRYSKNWYFNTRGVAMTHRNRHIRWLSPTNSAGGYPNNVMIAVRPQDAFNATPLPLANPIPVQPYFYRYDLRADCPALYTRLQELFVVRQITVEDLPGIQARIIGG